MLHRAQWLTSGGGSLREATRVGSSFPPLSLPDSASLGPGLGLVLSCFARAYRGSSSIVGQSNGDRQAQANEASEGLFRSWPDGLCGRAATLSD